MNAITQRYYHHVFFAAREVDFDDTVDVTSIESLVDACHNYAHEAMTAEKQDFSASLQIHMEMEDKLKHLLAVLFELNSTHTE